MMNTIVADKKMRELFKNFEQTVELVDECGNPIGVILPDAVYRKLKSLPVADETPSDSGNSR